MAGSDVIIQQKTFSLSCGGQVLIVAACDFSILFWKSALLILQYHTKVAFLLYFPMAGQIFVDIGLLYWILLLYLHMRILYIHVK